MIVFIAIFICISLYGVKVKPPEGQSYMTDYMSPEKTSAIKGLFIFIVFFQHFNSYVDYSLPIDKAYLKYFNMIGQCMVTLFLFYSGYGVMESIKKKQMSYVRRIPVGRVLGTLLPFDTAVVIFALISLATGGNITLKQFLLSLVAWDSVGNSNWYILAILASYALTYIAFMIFRDKGKYYPAAALLTVLTVLYVFALSHAKDSYWYDTVILYACGVWYSLLREKIEKIINKNIFVWLAFFVVSCVLALYFMKNRSQSFIHLELCMILFASSVVLFTMRVSLNNAVLRWCGKNLFGLYILQRIPMIVFKAVGLMDFNIYVYFILSLIVTAALAWVFGKYTSLVKKLLSPKRKTESKAN